MVYCVGISLQIQLFSQYFVRYWQPMKFCFVIFRNGRWRAEWVVTLKPDGVSELKGLIRVQVRDSKLEKI